MPRPSSPLDLVRKLSEIGIALSAESDHGHLTERILESAMELSRADGGTLYLVKDDALRFEILINRSRGIHEGGSRTGTIERPSLPLRLPDGSPNDTLVATRAAILGETSCVADAYACKAFDHSGTHAFDEAMGYRSVSFLTVPMRNHEAEVIGVLQLINARETDGETIRTFDAEDCLVVESLASQAAILLTQRQLLADQRILFEKLVEVLAEAIDKNSPHTGQHCRRVPALTLMLAEAAAAETEGPLGSFTLTPEEHYELKIAAWLHDCGKVATPSHLVEKATKLQTLFDRIELVRARFEILRRDAEIEWLRHRLAQVEPPGTTAAAADHGLLRETSRRLAEEEAFVARCNTGQESMPDVDRMRVRTIARRPWTDVTGNTRSLLEDDEVENLTVKRGTLTPEERRRINDHILVTKTMLEALPFPRYLRRVPELAGAHHEHVDGSGFPQGLTRDEMSVGARAMAIADVFEALTAADRPYKSPTPVSKAVAILRQMKESGKVDPDLFDLFLLGGTCRRWATEHLPPEQLDWEHVPEIGATPDAHAPHRIRRSSA